MYGMFRILSTTGCACALALTLACNSAPDAPAAPTAAAPAADEGAAADGSTLKVSAPALVSPTGDIRLNTRRPTLVAGTSSGKFASGDFAYEFQLQDDGGNVVRSATIGAGDGTTRWDYPEDLARDTPYRWRVRATFNGAFGPWSPQGRFLTVRENRAPNPAPGTRLPRPDWGFGVVQQIASQRPDLIRRSCQERGGTWEFMDLVVDTLRLQDTRFGYNGKRGNPNDPSHDVVAYNYGSNPDNLTTDVYIIDVMAGHCGPFPGAAWIDVTDVTRQQGSIGRWITRGRFSGSQGVQ